MQNYRLLFTENNTNDRYLILLNISALKCPDSDTVATDLQKITDHLAIYQSGREGIKMVLEHYKNTYPDLNYKSYNGFDYLDLTCSDIIGIHNL